MLETINLPTRNKTKCHVNPRMITQWNTVWYGLSSGLCKRKAFKCFKGSAWKCNSSSVISVCSWNWSFLLSFNQHKILLRSSVCVQCDAVHGAEIVQTSSLLPPGMEICSDSHVNSQAGEQSWPARQRNNDSWCSGTCLFFLSIKTLHPSISAGWPSVNEMKVTVVPTEQSQRIHC